MSGSNCCFLTCIQVCQEPGKVVWISHLFKNFPQTVVIHTVKGFSVVREIEVDGFLEFPCSARSQAMSLLIQSRSGLPLTLSKSPLGLKPLRPTCSDLASCYSPLPFLLLWSPFTSLLLLELPHQGLWTAGLFLCWNIFSPDSQRTYSLISSQSWLTCTF